MTRRLLITGGSGLLAVNWAASRKHQDDVWIGLNQRCIRIENTRSITLADGLDLAIKFVKPDLIIHTAAMTNVESCEADKKKALAINCDLAKNYAKSARDHDLPFIHISTDHLFNGLQPMVNETWPCSPINNYGYSKWLGELAVLEAHPNALIVRVNFFGWGPPYRPSFSDWILDNLSQNSEITLYKNVYFTPLYVGDVISLTHQLIDQDASVFFT